ncbi:MAG TPA: hypothetical protein VH253_20345 [Phycisphaerae bacterium]|nr:hypothetical protein [Phycisphaerae bacterium]
MHRLRTSFRILCLVLAGLLLFIIVRSYFISDRLYHAPGTIQQEQSQAMVSPDVSVTVSRGAIEVYSLTWGSGGSDSGAFWQYELAPPIALFDQPFYAAHLSRNISFPGFFDRELPVMTSAGPLSSITPGHADWAFSLYYLLFLVALYPVMHAISMWRQRRRHSQDLCTRCGYDLRASKDRCPECGTPFSENPKQMPLPIG